jgi:hypothetical protein
MVPAAEDNSLLINILIKQSLGPNLSISLSKSQISCTHGINGLTALLFSIGFDLSLLFFHPVAKSGE